METNLYSIFDSKTKAFLTPWHARTRGEAIRSFTEACNDPKTPFHKYPEDFTLFEIGKWDDNTGQIEQHPIKETLGLAIQYKNVDDQQELRIN